MGLFKSAEEKELKRLEKEQKKLQQEEEKEQKRLEKEYKLLSKYGLTDLTDERDIEAVKNIIYSLMGSGMTEMGALLSNNEKGYLQVISQYQRAIFEQNMIMIRMLNKIANK